MRLQRRRTVFYFVSQPFLNAMLLSSGAMLLILVVSGAGELIQPTVQPNVCFIDRCLGAICCHLMTHHPTQPTVELTTA